MRRWMLSAAVVVALSGAAMAQSKAAAEAEAARWKAGAAAVDITPTRMMWMAGYASRTKPAEDVMQPLFAKALAIEDERGGRMVFVTTDLVGIPRHLRDELERDAGERFNLAGHALLLNASHTHCGPELRIQRMINDERDDERIAESRAYVAELKEKMLEVIGRAIGALAPAHVSYAHARAGFAMNRRTWTGTEWRNFPNPDGPVDHSVPVLRVDSPEGKLRAVMFGYACHTTTLSIYRFNGDYAGYAQQYVEEANEGAIALFMAGCGGDQNPYPRRQGPYVEHHGRTLANAVLAALDTRPRRLSGSIASALEEVTLDFQPLPSREGLGEIVETSPNRYQKAHAARMLRMLDDGGVPMTYPYLVQAVQLGDSLTLVGLAGEVVVDYSLRLKGEIDSPIVWVAGYCNDVFGYVPSLRVLKEGGYEGGGAMIHQSLPGPFAETIEERIVGKVHELVGRVRSGGGR